MTTHHVGWYLGTVRGIDCRGIMSVELDQGRTVQIVGSASLAPGERVWVRKHDGGEGWDVERVVTERSA